MAEEFARSFLDHHPAPSDPTGWPVEDLEVGTRAYLLTGGRTGGGKADVRVETMVLAQPVAAAPGFLTPEQDAIIATVRDRAMAVAEIAARTGLVLGVAQVLIGDLVHDHVLTPSQDASSIHDDIPLLERMIACVNAL